MISKSMSSSLPSENHAVRKALAKRRINIAVLFNLDYVRNDAGIVATLCTMLVDIVVRMIACITLCAKIVNKKETMYLNTHSGMRQK
jgi:hypothetical protein